MNRSCCFILGSLMLLTNYCALAITDTAVKESENKVLQVFIKRQVNQSMSVGRAVGSITSNYPNEVETIVATALDLYPDNYQDFLL